MSKEQAAGDFMTIVPIGGGQEVGRSCILLTYRSRTVMLDCGTHPGKDGNDSLPFFDSIDDPSQIDLVLVTHFHIDHCAGLPYFTEKTNFKGKILMTHATKAVMKLLLSDNIRLQSKARSLYDEKVLTYYYIYLLTLMISTLLFFLTFSLVFAHLSGSPSMY